MKKILMVGVLGVFLVGCGKRYTLGEVVGEVMAMEEAVVVEMAKAKDVESARLVAERIDGIGDELVEVGAKLSRLEEVDDEGRSAARKRFMRGVERVRSGVKSGLKGVEHDAEAARILAEALERFEEKAGGVEERLRDVVFGG